MTLLHFELCARTISQRGIERMTPFSHHLNSPSYFIISSYKKCKFQPRRFRFENDDKGPFSYFLFLATTFPLEKGSKGMAIATTKDH